MSVVDNRIVQMLFDNKQFESGVKESSQSLNNLNKLLDGFGSGPTSNAGTALLELAEKFNHLGIVGITVIQNLVNKLTDDLTRAIKSVSIDQVMAGFGKYEDKLTSVQTIMSATTQSWKKDADNIIKSNDLLGEGIDKNLIDPLLNLYDVYTEKGKVTAQQLRENGVTAAQWAEASKIMGESAEYSGSQMEYVSEQLDRLNWFTDETSYSFTDMTSNIGKFTSQGQSLSDSVKAMEGIATWAAKSGQNAQAASRAMYNMSQALGVGSVKLMDWKSIENANMATVEFKQTAMDTAVALGKLTKQGEKYYTVGKHNEVTTANFSQTLSEAWFSADVLMGTLDKYGGFAVEIGEVTAAFEDQGLTTTKLLQGIEKLEKFGKDSDEFQTWLQTTGVAAEDLVPSLEKLASKEYELGRASFKAAQEAKTFSEAMDATKDAVSTAWMNVFEHLFGNYEEAKVLWTDLANNLYTLFAEPVWLIDDLLDRLGAAEAIRNAISSIGDLAEAFENGILAKRDDIIETVGLVFDYTKGVIDAFKDFVSSVLTPIKEAFQEIFPPKTGFEIATTISKILLPIKELFKAFTLGEGPAGKLKTTFEGIFSIVGILIDAFDAVRRVFRDIIPDLAGFGDGILDGTSKLGGFIKNIRETLKENDTFYTVLSKLVNFIKPAFSTIIKIANKVIDVFVKLFSKKDDGEGFFSTLSTGFGKLTDILSGFSSVLEVIKSVASSVWNFIKGIFTSIKEFVSGIDFSKINFGDILTTGVTAGAGIGLISVFKSIKDFFDGNSIGGLMDKLKDIGSTLEGILSSIKGAIQGFTNDLNAGALLKVAAALLVLAIALAAFAAISQMEGIEDGLLIMTAAFGALFGALKVMDSIKSKVAATATALLILSVAMLVLAGAVAAFAAIAMMPTFEEGMILFAATLLTVTLALTALGKLDAKILAAAAALLVLSVSMVILAAALAAFAAIAMMPTFETGLILFVATLLAATVALTALGKLGPEILAAGAALLMLSVSMFVLAAALAAFAAIAMMPTFQDGLLALVIVLGVAVVALTALGNLGPEVLAGAAALLILSVAMIALAAAFAAFSAVAMMDTFEVGLIAMAASLLVLTLALIALAEVGPMVIVGAAALLVGAAAIGVLAVAVGACALVLPLLANGLRALFEMLVDVAGQIVELIFHIIDLGAEALVTIADSIGQAIDVLFQGIGAAIETLGSSLGEAISALFEGIGEGITFLGDGIGKSISAVGEGIGRAIEEVLASIGEGIGRGLEAIGTGIEKVGDSISKVGDSIGNVGDGIKRFGDGVRSLSDIQWLKLAGGIAGIITPLKDLSKIDLSGINANLGSVVTGLNAVEKACSTMAQVGQSSVDAFVSAIKTGASKATSAATMLGQSAAKAVNQVSAWAQAGMQAVSAFISGIMNSSYASYNAGSSLASSGASGAYSAYYEYYSAGSYSAQGFINGINANAYMAYNAGASIGRQVVKGTRDVTKITSPSKVFYEMGKYVDQGFAEGIDDYSYLASKSAGEMALDSMAAVTDALANSIENDYANPVIRPTLDLSEVSAGASQISSMFGKSSIGVNGAYSANAVNGGTATGESTVNNFYIYSHPGQSVNEIADAVERRLNMNYRQRKAAGLS